jgi:hypothetical protein
MEKWEKEVADDLGRCFPYFVVPLVLVMLLVRPTGCCTVCSTTRRGPLQYCPPRRGERALSIIIYDDGS